MSVSLRLTLQHCKDSLALWNLLELHKGAVIASSHQENIEDMPVTCGGWVGRGRYIFWGGRGTQERKGEKERGTKKKKKKKGGGQKCNWATESAIHDFKGVLPPYGPHLTPSLLSPTHPTQHKTNWFQANPKASREIACIFQHLRGAHALPITHPSASCFAWSTISELSSDKNLNGHILSFF